MTTEFNNSREGFAGSETPVERNVPPRRSGLEALTGMTSEQLNRGFEREIKRTLDDADYKHCVQTAKNVPFRHDKGDYIKRRAYQMVWMLSSEATLHVAHHVDPELSKFREAYPLHVRRCREAIYETACTVASGEFDTKTQYWYDQKSVVEALKGTHDFNERTNWRRSKLASVER